jgi:hypothetical protein
MAPSQSFPYSLTHALIVRLAYVFALAHSCTHSGFNAAAWHQVNHSLTHLFMHSLFDSLMFLLSLTLALTQDSTQQHGTKSVTPYSLIHALIVRLASVFNFAHSCIHSGFNAAAWHCSLTHITLISLLHSLKVQRSSMALLTHSYHSDFSPALTKGSTQQRGTAHSSCLCWQARGQSCSCQTPIW